MTNLYLNDSRTIAMGNRQHINSGLGKVNKVEILSKIKSVFFQHFEQSVEDCCMRIDLEFGLQLGKSRENMSKDQYIKLLEYLRSVRREIKQSYLLKVNDLFEDSYHKAVNDQGRELDFSKVALIGDDAVKEDHAITVIIRQCEHAFYEELASLNKQLALQQGKQTIADSQNPVFPEKLVRALVDVVKSLKLNADSRIALYKAFEVNVFSHLGFIYCELIKQCETATSARTQNTEQRKDQHSSIPNSMPLYLVGEIKEDVVLTSALAEQPSAEFKLLQKKLELWRLAHFPSAYDLISVTGNMFYEHFEIKNALQVLQQFSDDLEPNEKKQPLKWRVLKKLEELSFSVDVKILAKHDEDVLDLVALIFSEIEQDELLQDTVKKAILRLEIPLAAASLGQYSIFTSRDNPVRQLLDDLFSAGMFLNTDEYDDRLIQERIASAVKKMTKENGFEFSGWMVEAGEFSSYWNKQKQRSHNIEENAKQLMRDKYALASSRKIVFAAIENSIKDKSLPIAIVDFLHDVWSDVLLAAYSGKDEQPEQWEKSVQTMDTLIVSVMPPADDDERKQVLKLLPGLITELRKGLKQISHDKSAQSRFFKDLAVLHIILMDKKAAKKTVGDIEKESGVAVESEKIKTVAILDDSTKQAAKLAVGNWVAFASESGKQWGKLIWKDTNDCMDAGAVAGTEAMLFVGKNGVKILEIQAGELAEKLRLGQASIAKINEKTITERLLSELATL